MPPLTLEVLVKFDPYRRASGMAGNDAILDTPGFLAAAPAHQFQFEAVGLDIYTARQHGGASRNGRAVVLATGQQFREIDARLRLIVPGLREHSVDELPQRFRRLLIHQELPGEVPPLSPW